MDFIEDEGYRELSEENKKILEDFEREMGVEIDFKKYMKKMDAPLCDHLRCSKEAFVAFKLQSIRGPTWYFY